MSQTASNSFTYDNNLTPQISGMSPSTTSVIGELSIHLSDNFSEVGSYERLVNALW